MWAPTYTSESLFLAEYELHYKKDLGEENPDDGKPFRLIRLDLINDTNNQLFCKSHILYSNPNGAPDDEVAMISNPSGDGIMMEWERPISVFFLPFSHLCSVSPSHILFTTQWYWPILTSCNYSV